MPLGYQNYIKANVNKQYLFNQVKRLMPLHSRKLYFTGMVKPLIDSGSVVWGSCGRSLLMNVHKMMKQYAWVILNVKARREISTVMYTVSYSRMTDYWCSDTFRSDVCHAWARPWLTRRSFRVKQQCARLSHPQLNDIQPVLRSAYICL